MSKLENIRYFLNEILKVRQQISKQNASLCLLIRGVEDVLSIMFESRIFDLHKRIDTVKFEVMITNGVYVYVHCYHSGAEIKRQERDSVCEQIDAMMDGISGDDIHVFSSVEWE